MNELYKMGLHTKLIPSASGYTEILRVPGGWIYTILQPYTNRESGDTDYRSSSVFVPYHVEFEDIL